MNEWCNLDIYYQKTPAMAGLEGVCSKRINGIDHPQIPACAGISNLIAAIIMVHQIPTGAGTCKYFLLSKCGIYCVNTCYCRLVTLYMIGGWYALL